jgi:hypothetical protein
MAVYTGSGVKVTYGAGATDLDATSWTLESTIDLVENTKLGATFKTYTTGFKDWTATAECILKTESTPLTNFAQAAATVSFYINGSNYFEADGICTSITPRTGTDNVIRMTMTFEGSDAAAGIAFN